MMSACYGLWGRLQLQDLPRISTMNDGIALPRQAGRYGRPVWSDDMEGVSLLALSKGTSASPPSGSLK